MQMRAPFPFLSTTLPSPFPLLPFPSRRPFHYRATACCGGGIRHACLLAARWCCTAWALPCQICLLPAHSSLSCSPARSLRSRPRRQPTHAYAHAHTRGTRTHTHTHPHAKREHTLGRSRRPSLLRPVAPRLPRPLSTPVNSLHPPSLSFSSLPPRLPSPPPSPSSLSPLIILVCDNTCNGLG
jgi:hypothetical protein